MIKDASGVPMPSDEENGFVADIQTAFNKYLTPEERKFIRDWMNEQIPEDANTLIHRAAGLVHGGRVALIGFLYESCTNDKSTAIQDQARGFVKALAK